MLQYFNNHYNHPGVILLNNGAGYVRGRQSRSLLPAGEHGESCCLGPQSPIPSPIAGEACEPGLPSG